MAVQAPAAPNALATGAATGWLERQHSINMALLDASTKPAAKNLDALPTPSRRSRPLGQVAAPRRGGAAFASKTLANSHPGPRPHQSSPRPGPATVATAGRAVVQRSGQRRPSAPSVVTEPLEPKERNGRSFKTFSEGCVPADAGHGCGRSTLLRKNPLDPFNIERFAEAQKENGTFHRALGEIQSGRKSSCWMWFVIPSPPYVKNNIERGSSMNRKYAIRSDEEAQAFLKYESEGVDLRQNYFSILSAVLEHLKTGKAARSVIGGFDEPKLQSSVAFFDRITRDSDPELNEVLVQMARLMNVHLAK
eukprot:s683_g11.t1